MKWFTATPSCKQRHSSPPGNLSLIPPVLRSASPRQPRRTHPTARFCRHQVRLRCAADKGGGRAVEATVTTPIHPRAAQTVKHCPPPFSCPTSVCFNQWRGVTSGETKVPAVTFRPAPGVTDTPSTSTTRKQRETPASESAICCYVFSLWIRASKDHPGG